MGCVRTTLSLRLNSIAITISALRAAWPRGGGGGGGGSGIIVVAVVVVVVAAFVVVVAAFASATAAIIIMMIYESLDYILWLEERRPLHVL